jgi:hypothetical protein
MRVWGVALTSLPLQVLWGWDPAGGAQGVQVPLEAPSPAH